MSRDVCTWRPSVGTLISERCPNCGHAFALHIGADECPVCQVAALVDQARALIPQSTAEADAEPEQREKRPKPGDVLHIHETGRDHCLPGTVIDTAGRRSVYLDIGLVGGDNRYSSHTHDESRRADCSWHWPCEGDRAPLADPRPAPTAAVTVHIDGAELFRIMTTQALRQARRNPR